MAIFIYGVLSEDVVANSDVVIRRAKGNGAVRPSTTSRA